ncbi:MAG: hypothetical protein LBF68_01375 [Christensenellaceae bacterium]|jgi:hypothetical protein|nr:hypothetical protein [Christensenellaceae bacterium]
MDDKKYVTYEVSDELNARLIAEIARAKSLAKLKDYELAQMLGKTKQAYSAMVINGLSKLGNIEAIADVLGCKVDIKFIRKT